MSRANGVVAVCCFAVSAGHTVSSVRATPAARSMCRKWLCSRSPPANTEHSNVANGVKASWRSGSASFRNAKFGVNARTLAPSTVASCAPAACCAALMMRAHAVLCSASMLPRPDVCRPQNRERLMASTTPTSGGGIGTAPAAPPPPASSSSASSAPASTSYPFSSTSTSLSLPFLRHCVPSPPPLVRFLAFAMRSLSAFVAPNPSSKLWPLLASASAPASAPARRSAREHGARSVAQSPTNRHCCTASNTDHMSSSSASSVASASPPAAYRALNTGSSAS